MKTYALDTNIISYFLRKDKKVESHVRNVLQSGNGELIIPPLVYYEVRRGLLLKDARGQTAAFDGFCKRIPVGKITRPMLDEAARIYANLRGKVHDMDILIAAFCIVNDYILVTHNVKHFMDMSGLTVEDWAG